MNKETPTRNKEKPTKNKETPTREEGHAFIIEQLACGENRKEIADQLNEQGVPIATCYRWFREAYTSRTVDDPTGEPVKDICLGALHDCLRAAQSENDTENIAKYARELANVAQKLRASHI